MIETHTFDNLEWRLVPQKARRIIQIKGETRKSFPKVYGLLGLEKRGLLLGTNSNHAGNGFSLLVGDPSLDPKESLQKGRVCSVPAIMASIDREAYHELAIFASGAKNTINTGKLPSIAIPGCTDITIIADRV